MLFSVSAFGVRSFLEMLYRFQVCALASRRLMLRDTRRMFSCQWSVEVGWKRDIRRPTKG